MAHSNVLRQPGPGDSDPPHALGPADRGQQDALRAKLQQREHQHQDVLQERLQRHEHEHQDILQEKLQQREHEHEDVLREKLQRREHEHQSALLDRQRPPVDPFPTQLALIAIIAAIGLNGVGMLLELGHATPAKMAPFAGGLVAAFLPTLLAWTGMHKQHSAGGRAARYLARLLWILSIGLFAAGSLLAGL
ncbi:MAG: hypothetical protein WAV02_12580 [Stellaceae bacterium]